MASSSHWSSSRPSSIFFTISILWQIGLGHTALSSGVTSVPFALGAVVSSLNSNKLAQRLGRNVLVTGAAVMAGGLVWLWVVLRYSDPTGPTQWDLLLPLLIAGLGNGVFIAPNARFIIATVDQSDAGAASGVVATMQRVGSAIGIAVISSVLFGSLVITGSDSRASGFTNAAAHAMAVSAPSAWPRSCWSSHSRNEPVRRRMRHPRTERRPSCASANPAWTASWIPQRRAAATRDRGCAHVEV